MNKATIESICESIRIEWEVAHKEDQHRRFTRIAAMIDGIRNMLIYHDLETYDELKSDLHLLWSIAQIHTMHY